MLRLFQSIFGTASVEAGRYSEELVARAIERAVDATDPRLRLLSGYRRRLRPAVVHAIDYVMALVDRMKPPVALTRQSYATDPRLAAVFTSVEHMREVLSRDPALSAFRRGEGARVTQMYALLVMEKYEKKVLGMDLRGDVLQREVAQVSVDFAEHRLVDPAPDLAELKRLLKRRIYDGLLTLALARITQTDALRADLKRQQSILRRKLKVLGAGQWAFEAAARSSKEATKLEAQLAAIEARLVELRPDTETLSAHLDMLADVLNAASTQIAAARVPHAIDRMGIKRERPTDADLAFELGELRAADGRVLYVLPVSIAADELPAPVDFIGEVERHLS